MGNRILTSILALWMSGRGAQLGIVGDVIPERYRELFYSRPYVLALYNLQGCNSPWKLDGAPQFGIGENCGAYTHYTHYTPPLDSQGWDMQE